MKRNNLIKIVNFFHKYTGKEILCTQVWVAIFTTNWKLNLKS
jgi:hypothetical protein